MPDNAYPMIGPVEAHTLGRGEILAALRAVLEPLDYVHAMWEGGAAAFGRVDQWSDIDLQVDTDDAHAGEIFAIVERALRELTEIEVKVEVPQPAWHGHHQAFYRLRDAGPFLQLDLVAVVHSSPGKFLERAIHGKPVVHFDKSGVVTPVEIDVDAMLAKLRRRVEDIGNAYRLFGIFPYKEINRGNPIEAIAFYQSSVLRPLLEVLRIIHAPARHNFHTRYIHYDLPAALVAELEPLFFIPSPEMLPAACERAGAMLRDAIAGIDWGDVRELLEKC
jgi:hypothetical protein